VTSGRRGYLDWLRGLAVLIMIGAHVLDSWTRYADRDAAIFGYAMMVAGFGAPLFLFLAGLSVALSAGAKLRRGRPAREAARAVARRGVEIFALAFLFRLQSVVVSWGSWASMLKVDILNIMGPCIVAAALLWGALRTTAARLAAFVLVAAAIGFATPPVRGLEALAALPDPLEAYIRPLPALTAFPLFPWAGFVFAGAAVGVILEKRRSPPSERQANLQFAATGALLAAGAYAASFQPSPYANSNFWTSAPSFFFLRLGILVAAVPLAFAWRNGRTRWSPVEQIGRTSLFIYWIHIELIYGLMVRPLHKALSLGEAAAGVVLFTALMVAVSVLKERLWDSRRVLMRTGGGRPEAQTL